MKKLNRFSFQLFSIAFLVLSAAPAFSQGNLTPPPGAPAPTMKTLDQIEPRIGRGPSGIAIGINSPGSYFLAGDINSNGSGVVINASNVTLDLNGFSIRKSSGTGFFGILINGEADNDLHNITIRNGHISGAFTDGIKIERAHNVTIEDVAIQGTVNTGILAASLALPPNNVTIRRCRILGSPVDAIANAPVTGISDAGIQLRFGMTFIVENCVVANITGNGIEALTGSFGDVTSSAIIRDCLLSRCGKNGIFGNTNGTVPRGILIERCSAEQCGIVGIGTDGNARIVDCIANFNTSDGIRTGGNSVLITGCQTASNGRNGIQIASDSVVKNCVSDSNGTVDGAGIHVTGTDCVIQENTILDNNRGVDVDAVGNLIIKNNASGNTINFDLVANNKVGPIVAAPNSAAISGGTGGAGVGSTDPWANISF